MLQKSTLAVALAAATCLGGGANAADLVINFDDLNPGPKQGFDDAVALFQKENPDINVIVNNNDREAHKTAIRNFLTADAPDVTSWYPGNRMAPFVDAGLFEPVTDLWEEEGFGEHLAAIKPTMTRDGEIWGVPYSYYQWGIYYRKDIFDLLELEEPQTWDELLSACGKMKENGVTPFTIGTKFLWPAAGVFDYINLRTNGYETHMALTAGEVKYTDEPIRETFANFETLINECGFVENHASMSWQDAIAPFSNGDAAMYVMGNFAVDAFLNSGLDVSQLDFFPFPTIDPDVPAAEEAPTDAFFIPANAKNKEDARKFLAFVARPDVQTQWNKTMGQLPINSQADVSDDKFIQEGFAMLNKAQGLAQFFDRDAPAEMAKAGMEGFQRFMTDTSTLEEVLQRLDEVQAQVY
ncbi:carbohydrate ABC transporter substrate-binding protein, CUT1 family [Poseidonocella pacifica]|uniref:Carbohydrate ABC transporter substrate-binding protein, CUT1 family n=1 Tax=Poseidonocella pacifica TaxID=871651 RepID=A0A1I0XV08_9RHOB|nr:extracellular solute-binding protein [Poseidonocella pacifica]SFB04831.1 carbohydrate ABC transporter substrate-binding protein, CUT1 family [Poseidonocella pacifica]